MSDETIREAGNAELTVREEQPAEIVREQQPIETVREIRSDMTVREVRQDATVREDVSSTTVREIQSRATVRESLPSETIREAQLDTTICELRNDATTREEAPSTTVREGTSETVQESREQSVRPRTNLPIEVLNDYEWVKDFAQQGGEADVSLIRERTTGILHFFKHYHQSIYPEESVMSILAQDGNEQYIARIIDYSCDVDDAWEIQEYYELGTLEKGIWASEHTHCDDETIKQIVKSASESIRRIHELNIAHRDIKPSNLLISSESPLNIVLTDFGISRDEQSVTHRTTFAGTNLYAAPEAHSGKASQKSDWFALGAIIYRLLTEKHLLANKNSDAEPRSKDAEVNCLERAYYGNVESIESERWQLLIKGLVTYDREYRWGYDEVKRWLDGESPKVFWVRGVGGYYGVSIEKCYQAPWSDELIENPRKLAISMGKNWDDAKRALAGREKARIIEFLSQSSGLEKAVEIINSKELMDAKLLEIQFVLNDAEAPYFYDCKLDSDSIKKRIESAGGGDSAALDWLENLVNCDGLILFGEYNSDKKTSNAGNRLRKWLNQANFVKKSIPDDKHSIADEAFKKSLPELFSLAFGSKDKR